MKDNREALKALMLEIIKGFEPIGHSDGKGGTVPLGYDLDKDGRTKFGFYLEYEDMADCATRLMAAVDEYILGALPERKDIMADPPDIAKDRPHAITAVRDYRSGWNAALEEFKENL